MTVTVWKNKIRVRHASLGELRQKTQKNKTVRELDKNQNRHASVFSLRHKSSQIISKAQQQGKTNCCLAGGVKGGNILFIYFSYPLLNEYRR